MPDVTDVLHYAQRAGVSLEGLGRIQAEHGIDRFDASYDATDAVELAAPASRERIDAYDAWQTDSSYWLLAMFRGAQHASRPACPSAARLLAAYPDLLGMVELSRRDGGAIFIDELRVVFFCVPRMFDPLASVDVIQDMVDCLPSGSLLVPPLADDWNHVSAQLAGALRGRAVVTTR